MNRRFEFPIDIENALMDRDSIPTCRVEGIPGEMYIVSPDQIPVIEEIINTLDNVDSKELETWTTEEKSYYSRLLNSADVVYKKSVTRE